MINLFYKLRTAGKLSTLCMQVKQAHPSHNIIMMIKSVNTIWIWNDRSSANKNSQEENIAILHMSESLAELLFTKPHYFIKKTPTLEN